MVFLRSLIAGQISESMKIVLISNYLPDGSPSMLRYAQMLERHLKARGHAVRVVHPRTVLGGGRCVRGPIAKWIRYVDKFLLAPPQLRRECLDADVVHVCDHGNAMYLRCAGEKPQVLTCHDLLAVNAARGRYVGVRVGLTGRLYQRWIASWLGRARNLICVSEKTRQDVLELTAGAEIWVIHHPLNFDYRPAAADAVERVLGRIGFTAGTEYFFHVGGNNWYKNRLGVMKIYAELKKLPRFARARLVMAGRPWTPEMRAFCRGVGLVSETVEAVGVGNEELAALYSGALALLFPSREEGFGWPILEAQACGCPVVTTNRGPMTEIAGEGALLIDPDDPGAAAEAIARGLPEFERLRGRGFRNVAQFTVERAMDAYEEAYRAAIEGSTRWARSR